MLIHRIEGGHPLSAPEGQIIFSSRPPSRVGTPCHSPPPPSSKREPQVSTCLPKEPPLIEAAGKENRSLGKGHEEVADCEVDDEHVGRHPEASAPVRGWKSSEGASAGELPSLTPVHTLTHTYNMPTYMHMTNVHALRGELLGHRPIPPAVSTSPTNSSVAWLCRLRSKTPQVGNLPPTPEGNCFRMKWRTMPFPELPCSPAEAGFWTCLLLLLVLWTPPL